LQTAHTYFWTIEGPRQQQGGADGPVDSAKVDVPDVPDSNMTVVGYLFGWSTKKVIQIYSIQIYLIKFIIFFCIF
jgi:hypothetical protein